jgi:hypothetical protein
MTRIYVPSQGSDSWRILLADPDKHWRTRFSAKNLACCWEAAQGRMPREIAELFAEQGANPELLLALPEHKVPLAGSKRGDSQSDLFALIRAGDKTFAATIEGKVDEPFDRSLGEWLDGASPGKRERLAFICDLLGLTLPLPNKVYYQLLHRTAAAVIEARRFKTDAACMIVHSFSPTRKWYAAFEVFATLFGVPAKPNRLLLIRPDGLPPLYVAWAAGDPKFLAG